MNWKLILQLSLFGLAMGLATVFFVPSNIEPLLWMAIFVFCAYTIARQCARGHFLHGFLLGLANCFWITTAHILFAGEYLSRHTQEAEMMKSMPMPDSPRLMMAMVGPAVGVISGLIIGLFALIMRRFIKTPLPQARVRAAGR
jgi:hypothetical protein